MHLTSFFTPYYILICQVFFFSCMLILTLCVFVCVYFLCCDNPNPNTIGHQENKKRKKNTLHKRYLGYKLRGRKNNNKRSILLQTKGKSKWPPLASSVIVEPQLLTVRRQLMPVLITVLLFSSRRQMHTLKMDFLQNHI